MPEADNRGARRGHYAEPGLSEDEYLALVERIQKSMMWEPFRPDVVDVVALIGAWRVQQHEIERWRTLPIVLDKEQQALVREQGAEIERLRADGEEGAREILRQNAEIARLHVELTHRVGWEERALDAEAAADRFRAEVKRLTEAEGEFLAEIRRLRAERDVLIREFGQFKNEQREARSHLSNLLDGAKGQNEILHGEGLRMQAEAERLRAALRQLIAACEREDWDEPDADLEAARTALVRHKCRNV
jgi:hypothetical protein